MFRRGLKIGASWKVDEKVEAHLDGSVSKQEMSARKVKWSNGIGGYVAGAGGRDHAKTKDGDTYKYVLPERRSYHAGGVE
jgi:hypothetical protein